MPTVTVKFFNSSKGFGSISPDGGGNDVFVHISELERSGISSLNDGDKVSFESKMDPKKGKPNAVNVKRVATVAFRPRTERFSRHDIQLGHTLPELAVSCFPDRRAARLFDPCPPRQDLAGRRSFRAPETFGSPTRTSHLIVAIRGSACVAAPVARPAPLAFSRRGRVAGCGSPCSCRWQAR